MGDRAGAIGALTAVPINIGIVVGILLHYIGHTDVVCVVVGAAIAVPGAIVIFVLLMRDLRKQDGEK